MNYIKEEINLQVDKNGYYGNYGGVYIPEMLFANVNALAQNYLSILESEEFKSEFLYLLQNYCGRPTPLTFAPGLSEKYKTSIFLKREDLNHTGSHKINNAIGQLLIARKLGKKRIIAETGAGQHGVAVATVCAYLKFPCVIYMGKKDIERQSPNVSRIKLLGAKVIAVSSGSQTLKDATNEALRDWIANPLDTHYVIGSVVGPHPFPDLVMRLQRIIGQEIAEQIESVSGNIKPDAILACAGGGSNAAGAFYDFIADSSVSLYLAEAGGLGILSKKTAASILSGSTGIIHGMKTKLLQDEYGQIIEPHSISAGLDYPGIGPIHAHLAEINRIQVLAVNDDLAIQSGLLLMQTEGIISALESAHALAILELVKFKKENVVVVNLSGRGDKDINVYSENLNHGKN